MTQPLLTSPRTKIWNVAKLFILALLLFSPNYAVFDVNIKCTCACTVCSMGSSDNLVPSPFITIYVFGPTVRGFCDCFAAH